METTELIITNPTPASLISQAIDKNTGVAELEKLMELQERWEKREAQKKFLEAFTQFQHECPDLRKTKKVDFGTTKYFFAPLADITRQLADVLQKCGLSYRWEIKDESDKIQVTCIVAHTAGHKEFTTMTGGPDATGSKNSIQARGSAVEYLKRYTLIGALGISTADMDIDGRLPDLDIDKLYKEYISVYDAVIQLDPGATKYHPDNWKSEPTPKAYVAAISELRKILFEMQKAKK